MRLASWIRDGKTSYGIVRPSGGLIDLRQRFGPQLPDLRSLLAANLLSAACLDDADERTTAQLAEVSLLPPVPNPGKILCVGINYPERNAEYKDGSALPKYPSLFVRFPNSLVGHAEAIFRPIESAQFDYEGEIVIAIGKGGRRIPLSQADGHIAGLTLMNDGSVRDWLRHGKFNVTQGKNFDRSGSVGPWLVTPDETGPFDCLTVVTRVNGEERQHGETATLLFSFAQIITYISTFTTLEPGDLIATGTPPGAGGRFDPPRWLRAGDVVEVGCPTIGILRNTVVDEVV
jgi:2-keto-4-pentenoate hydratase/2-oxohepta-3-ene-1,7-dioic acid hydratase in catechol pathway